MAYSELERKFMSVETKLYFDDLYRDFTQMKQYVKSLQVVANNAVRDIMISLYYRLEEPIT